jgi:hypothetical protein
VICRSQELPSEAKESSEEQGCECESRNEAVRSDSYSAKEPQDSGGHFSTNQVIHSAYKSEKGARLPS